MTKQRNAKAGSARKRRVTVRRKSEAVKRVIRGDPIEQVALSLEVAAADISRWQEIYFKAAYEALEDRPYDDPDEEIKRLRTKLSELNTANDLLQERIEKIESEQHPLWQRKPR